MLPQTFIQYFSFPPKFISYISKTSSSGACQKLIKSCKYFYFKQQKKIIFVQNLNRFSTQSNIELTLINGAKKNLSCVKEEEKLFIYETFKIFRYSLKNNKKFTSNLLKKIAFCQLKSLCLNDQEISYSEFIFLVGGKKLKEFIFHDCIITKKCDGSIAIVPFENIIEKLPDAIYIEYFDEKTGATITPKTSKKLSEIFLHRKCVLYLNGIPEYFDAEDFCIFAKKNSSSYFILKENLFLGPRIMKHDYVWKFQNVLAEQKIRNVFIDRA